MEQQLKERIDREVQIPAGPVTLAGHLFMPAFSSAVVLFSHGSGSSRHSPRNLLVASVIEHAGVGTLLFDLLSAAEEEVDRYTSQHRFDIPLLAERLVRATQWIDTQPELRDSRIGYFGASTGSAAALVAAAQLSDRVGAVVSRGGRPDLAMDVLHHVTAPTLLVIGGNDDVVIHLNQQAYERLKCDKRIAIVPGASHLFEEPGTLEQVADLASRWFEQHLVSTVKA